MNSLILLRHGQSQWNLENRFTGWKDVPLTKKGIEEAIKAGLLIKENKIKIDNQEIIEILTVNGVRFSFIDGSWGLIRASSNKPSLVVVTESPTSDDRKIKIFRFIDQILQKTGKVGKYDQKI